MVTEPTTHIVAAQGHQGSHSDEEPDAQETTPLLRGDGADGINASRNVTVGALWRRPLAKLSKLSRRDVGYGILFSVPLLLFIPALVFFVMTMNPRAGLPPSSSLEIISNLTHRVSKLSESLGSCKTNSSTLANSLHKEQQRVKVCKASERRLAERIDVVEEMLDTCRHDEAGLKLQLEETRGELNICVDDREELKRQMESGVFVQFLDMVGKMGTGGDSWVCSDATLSWSHGYTSTDSPHPTITVKSWSADLDDGQHSAVPLVFPPTSEELTSKDTHMPTYQPLVGSRVMTKSTEKTENLASGRKDLLPLTQEPVIIVGYTVNSLNTSGNNGWWRITKLPAFAVKGSTLELFAEAAKWYHSTARYNVTVYWVSAA